MNTQQHLALEGLPPLGFKLSDIPEPGSCPLCGQPTQREFIEYFVYGSESVLRTTGLPGYGCTVCGEKTLHPESTRAMYRVVEKVFRDKGQIRNADDCSWEVEYVLGYAT